MTCKEIPMPKSEDLVSGFKVCGESCPWTGNSYGVDMGCLPSPWESVEHFNKTKEIYACHSNYSIPCKGLMKFLKKNGVDVTEYKLVPPQ